MSSFIKLLSFYSLFIIKIYKLNAGCLLLLLFSVVKLLEVLKVFCEIWLNILFFNLSFENIPKNAFNPIPKAQGNAAIQ